MNLLTITEARYKMLLARKRIERANAQIKELREFIAANNPEGDLDKRNKDIYQSYLAGNSFKSIAPDAGIH